MVVAHRPPNMLRRDQLRVIPAGRCADRDPPFCGSRRAAFSCRHVLQPSAAGPRLRSRARRTAFAPRSSCASVSRRATTASGCWSRSGLTAGTTPTTRVSIVGRNLGLAAGRAGGRSRVVLIIALLHNAHVGTDLLALRPQLRRYAEAINRIAGLGGSGWCRIAKRSTSPPGDNVRGACHELFPVSADTAMPICWIGAARSDASRQS